MFEFKFEKLLRIRTKLLDDKRMKIAAVQKEIEDLWVERERLAKENEIRRQKIFDILKSDKPDRNMVLFLSELIQKTENEITLIESKIEELRKKKKTLMDEAKGLLKEKKKLERLKAMQFEEYKLNQMRMETRFLDEIASIKAAHRINIGS